MKNSRTVRTLILACTCILSMVGLAACSDVVYKETGKELSMTKTVSPATLPAAGNVITFTYTVTNNNPVKGENRLDPMTIAISDAPLDAPVVCLKGVLDNGETTTCTAAYTVADEDFQSGCVANNAVATGIFISEDLIYPKGESYYNIAKIKHTASATVSTTVKINNSVTCDMRPRATPTSMTIATATATDLPPTPTETPVPLIPVLDGTVTYCDPAAHVMNLPFVNGFVASDYNHIVTMNGDLADCKVNASNSKLLTCSYPGALVFPARIQVAISGTLVNDFVFNGAECIVPEPRSTPKPKPCPPGKFC